VAVWMALWFYAQIAAPINLPRRHEGNFFLRNKERLALVDSVRAGNHPRMLRSS